MRLNRARRVIIKETKIDEAQNLLLGFPARYQNYHSTEYRGEWKIEQWANGDAMRFALIDREFSLDQVRPSMGRRIKSECPYFSVSLFEKEDAVQLNYQFKWQLRVRIMFLLTWLYVLLNFVFSCFAFGSGEYPQGVLFLLTAMLLSVILITYVLRRRKHDVVALMVFEEILRKNFKIDSVTNSETVNL